MTHHLPTTFRASTDDEARWREIEITQPGQPEDAKAIFAWSPDTGEGVAAFIGMTESQALSTDQTLNVHGLTMNANTPVLRGWEPRQASEPYLIGSTLYPVDATCMIMEVAGDAVDDQLFAMALSGNMQPALRLLEPCCAFEGYAWYDRIARLVDIVWVLQAGAETLYVRDLASPRVSEDGDSWRALTAGDTDLNDRIDTITLRMIVEGQTGRETVDRDADLILIGDGYAAEEYSVLLSRRAREQNTMTPDVLADMMVRSGFAPCDDAEADSHETQRRHYEIAAYAHACSVLIDKEAGDLAFIRGHADAHVKWTCPPERCVVITIENKSVAVAFREQSMDAAAKRRTHAGVAASPPPCCEGESQEEVPVGARPARA